MAFSLEPEEPEVDLTEVVIQEAIKIAALPAAERTESILAERLASICRTLPKALQIVFLERITEVIDQCDLIVPEPIAAADIPLEFLAECQQLKFNWRKSIMQNPITRMIHNGSWSWANAVEAEDELYPERKAERESKAAAAKAAIDAEEEAARLAEERKNRSIRDNKNPSLRPGNLYLGVTETDLRSVFEPFGRLTRVNVPKCRETGNTRGFAFVDFASPQDAAKAYHALNEVPRMLGNQVMRVEFASTELRTTRPGAAAAVPRRK